MSNPWWPAGRRDTPPSTAEIACAEAQARLLAEWWNDGESNEANLAAIAYWLDKSAGGGHQQGAA